MPVYYKNSKGAGVTAAKWMRGRVVGDYVRKEVGAMSAPPTSEPALSPGPLGPAASCLMTCPPPTKGQALGPGFLGPCNQPYQFQPHPPVASSHCTRQAWQPTGPGISHTHQHTHCRQSAITQGPTQPT